MAVHTLGWPHRLVGDLVPFNAENDETAQRIGERGDEFVQLGRDLGLVIEARPLRVPLQAEGFDVVERDELYRLIPEAHDMLSPISPHGVQWPMRKKSSIPLAVTMPIVRT
jgi:hypothetical protein